MNDSDLDKEVMTGRGQALVKLFCEKNHTPVPPINVWGPESRYYHVNSCGFYVPTDRRTHGGSINVMPRKCASIGYTAMAWSFPGYVIDRTPYGVLAHELGHAIDERLTNSRVWGAGSFRAVSGEARLTSYCPDDAEWFAEMFRLYVTNPDLLSLIRPKTFYMLLDLLPAQAETRTWTAVLHGAPTRTQEMAAKKISDAHKGRPS